MRESIVASVCLFLAVAGCGNQNMYFGTPDILHPGSLARQRWQAEVFDPYPVPYLGTPVEGGRPMQYKTPVPETEDNYKNPNGLGFRFGPPPPKYSLQDIWSAPLQPLPPYPLTAPPQDPTQYPLPQSF